MLKMARVDKMLRQWIDHTRQNHALEHATINLLSRRFVDAQVMGVSDPFGFTLYSTLPEAEIVATARRAIRALRVGHTSLAVHKNCGTNLVITAMLTTLATLVGFGYVPDLVSKSSAERSWGRFLERLPQVVLMNAMALIAAMPLARWVQENVTTSPTVHSLEIVGFVAEKRGSVNRVRVRTQVSRQADLDRADPTTA
jgi:hypothetical protein